MRLCFYSGVFARNGGIEEFTKDLALSLIDSGVDVEIVCASLKHPLLEQLKLAGAKIIRVPVYHGCRWNIPDYALFLFALVRVARADVVVHRKPLPVRFYRFLSRKATHIYITGYRPKEQFPSRTDRAKFFSFFDSVFTQTEIFRSDLIACGIRCPIHVIPHIPPPMHDLFERKNGQDRVVRVGMMGRLERQKNPLYAMEIMLALREARPSGIDNVEFHVYGTGVLEQEMRSRAEKERMGCFFHGRYHRSSVPEIVLENDLFLITSVSEGQCIVALEVLAGGRPLFATPVGALPEILRKSERGALLPENAANVAAKCICAWLADERPAAESIQRSYYQDYNTEGIKNRYVDLIKKTAQKEWL